MNSLAKLDNVQLGFNCKMNSRGKFDICSIEIQIEIKFQKNVIIIQLGFNWKPNARTTFDRCSIMIQLGNELRSWTCLMFNKIQSENELQIYIWSLFNWDAITKWAPEQIWSVFNHDWVRRMNYRANLYHLFVVNQLEHALQSWVWWLFNWDLIRKWASGLKSIPLQWRFNRTSNSRPEFDHFQLRFGQTTTYRAKLDKFSSSRFNWKISSRAKFQNFPIQFPAELSFGTNLILVRLRFN